MQKLDLKGTKGHEHIRGTMGGGNQWEVGRGKKGRVGKNMIEAHCMHVEKVIIKLILKTVRKFKMGSGRSGISTSKRRLDMIQV
jgi:hypothetical protein